MAMKWLVDTAFTGVAVYGFLFDHRTRAAFLAMVFRRRALSLAALAGPPFFPPSLPRATAAGFFSGGLSVVASSTMAAAISLGSCWVLDRLGMDGGDHCLDSRR